MSYQQPKFFRAIWHVNSILILIAGLGALLIVAMVVSEALIDSRRERTTINIETVDKDANEEDVWSLSQLSKVDGTPYFIISLRSERTTAQRSGNVAQFSGGSYYRSRNLLFMDSSGNPGQWLFPSNDQLIVSYRHVGPGHFQNDDLVVKYFLYEIVREDTNGDEQLDREDKRVLAISDPDGSNYTELIQGIDAFLGQSEVGDNELLVIFQREGTGFSAIVSLKEKRVIRELKLPEVRSGT